MAIPLQQPEAAAAEHKAVRKQIKKLKKVASTGQLDAAGEAELKALKKKAKALKAASTATGSGGEGGSDGGEATADQPAPGSKKKRKSAAAEDKAAAAAAAASAEQQQPAPKKQKKGKAGAAAAATPDGLAAVGDRQLASSRPQLVKALYSEAADVAAMSASDVAAWRKERKTAVEGCTLHPISTFAQSGGWGWVNAMFGVQMRNIDI